MKKMVSKIWETGEYRYEGAYGFEPELHGYLHEDSERRPCLIVAPGGGYEAVSPGEGEIVAKDFYERGYNTFVCVYTTNPLKRVPLKLQATKDLSRAVRWVRSRAEELNVNSNQVAICGFSAGGHLCASLCVHFADLTEENPRYASCSNRPDGAVLAYSVITTGELAHRGSVNNLLGKEASEEELRYMSLEYQVTKETTPCFLWHTQTDASVPVENSYRMAEALREKGVPYALHIFSEGVHGLSLSNHKWASNEYGEPYTTLQSRIIMDKIVRGEITVTEEERMQVLECTKIGQGPKMMQPEVAVWPQVADAWLKKIMG